MVQIGNKIKALRLAKSMTQEQLAGKLMVSPQAVSKWENGAAMPDIQLLPELSVALGATIDALFSMTDESRMERIDNMIWDERFIAEADFKAEEAFLKDKCIEPERRAKATLLLAELYCKRAREYNEMASPLARLALELQPDCKEAHNAIFDSEGGAYLDWNVVNHSRTIEFYKEFIAKHPQNRAAYYWILDLLVADRRCAEARDYLAKMNALGQDFNSLYYLGVILDREDKPEEALAAWRKMTEEYPNDANLWIVLGNEMAKRCRYDEAIGCFKKYNELSPKPHFVDAFECMAQVYEIKGEYQNAIDCYESVIDLLKNEWNETTGEAVDEPRRNIAGLREKLAQSASLNE